MNGGEETKPGAMHGKPPQAGARETLHTQVDGVPCRYRSPLIAYMCGYIYVYIYEYQYNMMNDIIHIPTGREGMRRGGDESIRETAP